MMEAGPLPKLMVVVKAQAQALKAEVEAPLKKTARRPQLSNIPETEEAPAILTALLKMLAESFPVSPAEAGREMEGI